MSARDRTSGDVIGGALDESWSVRALAHSPKKSDDYRQARPILRPPGPDRQQAEHGRQDDDRPGAARSPRDGEASLCGERLDRVLRLLEPDAGPVPVDPDRLDLLAPSQERGDLVIHV